MHFSLIYCSETLKLILLQFFNTIQPEADIWHIRCVPWMVKVTSNYRQGERCQATLEIGTAICPSYSILSHRITERHRSDKVEYTVDASKTNI